MQQSTTYRGVEPKLVVNPTAERILAVIERQLTLLEKLANETHWIIAEGTRIETQDF